MFIAQRTYVRGHLNLCSHEVLGGRNVGRKSELHRIIDFNHGLELHDVVYND